MGLRNDDILCEKCASKEVQTSDRYIFKINIFFDYIKKKLNKLESYSYFLIFILTGITDGFNLDGVFFLSPSLSVGDVI